MAPLQSLRGYLTLTNTQTITPTRCNLPPLPLERQDKRGGSRPIVLANYCYDLSLLLQRPSKTKQLWRLDAFD